MRYVDPSGYHHRDAEEQWLSQFSGSNSSQIFHGGPLQMEAARKRWESIHFEHRAEQEFEGELVQAESNDLLTSLEKGDVILAPSGAFAIRLKDPKALRGGYNRVKAKLFRLRHDGKFHQEKRFAYEDVANLHPGTFLRLEFLDKAAARIAQERGYTACACGNNTVYAPVHRLEIGLAVHEAAHLQYRNQYFLPNVAERIPAVGKASEAYADSVFEDRGPDRMIWVVRQR